MLNRYSIRTKLALIAVLPLMAMAVLATLAWTTLQAVKVGGPTEQRVQDAAEAVADVLPPPLFVVEPYLVVSQAAQPATPTDVRNDLLANYKTLRGEYVKNHEKWVPRTIPDGLRRSLLDDSYTTAVQFFELVEREVIPRIQAGDYAGAQDVLARDVQPVFAKHRRQILDVIAEAQTYAAGERRAAADAVSQRTFLFLMGLVVAAGATVLLGLVVSRTIRTSIHRLRAAAEEDLPRVIAELGEADDATLATAKLEPIDLGTNDELAEAADAFNAVLGTAVSLAAQQTVQRRHTAEMFVNLGRRNQNLVARQLKFIDSLEQSEPDADRLGQLFRLDNLATRMRRNAESLLVLAGVEPPRRWRKPVRLHDVVRGAMAEIEDFRRVQVESFDEVLVPGASVSNVTHLLAELIENAARFSPPDTMVTVTGTRAGDDYVLGVHDRGLGMTPDALAAANERIATAKRLDEVPTAYLGLFVVARLADREGITVELESPEGDGLTAWVHLPRQLLVDADQPASPEPVGARPAAAETPTAVRRLELAARADRMAEGAAPAAPIAPAAPAVRPAPFVPEVVADPTVLPARPAPVSAVPAPPIATPPPAPTPVGSTRPTPPADAWPAPAADTFPPPAVLAGPAPTESSLQPAPPADAPTDAPTEAGATRSGFKKRTRSQSVVEFDRFAASTPPTGQRSAEDMKDRLDRFAAGKRFATTRPVEPDTAEGDD